VCARSTSAAWSAGAGEPVVGPPRLRDASGLASTSRCSSSPCSWSRERKSAARCTTAPCARSMRFALTPPTCSSHGRDEDNRAAVRAVCPARRTISSPGAARAPTSGRTARRARLKRHPDALGLPPMQPGVLGAVRWDRARTVRSPRARAPRSPFSAARRRGLPCIPGASMSHIAGAMSGSPHVACSRVLGLQVGLWARVLVASCGRRRASHLTPGSLGSRGRARPRVRSTPSAGPASSPTASRRRPLACAGAAGIGFALVLTATVEARLGARSPRRPRLRPRHGLLELGATLNRRGRRARAPSPVMIRLARRLQRAAAWPPSPPAAALPPAPRRPRL
jgi:hypothetical protein